MTYTRVVGLFYLCRILWLLGYPAQALHCSQTALTEAHELAHPFSQAIALWWVVTGHDARRERRAAQENATALLTRSTDWGFAAWAALGTYYQGFALALQGQGAEGFTQMRDGLAAWRGTGTRQFEPYLQTLMATAYGETGQATKGLAVVLEALDTVERTGERTDEAELYRLKGELTLQSEEGSHEERAGEAEASFQKAIEVAQRQQAKYWELRATTSLARLWQQQGKKEEARQMLAKIYGWFTEGFDTADLKDAKALLEKLAP